MAVRPLHLQRDPYGEKILSGTFDWRDERVIEAISRFVTFGQTDSTSNARRQRAVRSGALLRSIRWKTWSQSGGDVQVFHAHYLYYAKFVELAVSGRFPFSALPPAIAEPRWKPIQMPDRPLRAKPMVATEMRKRARRFTTYVQEHFSYAGIAMMVYSMRTDSPYSSRINRSLFLHGLTGRDR